MLKELSSVQAYLPFIHAMLADPDFRDPMLATPAQLHQHLLDAHEDPAKHLFGTFDGGTLTGLFSVLVLPEEGYLQLLAGLSRQAAAYDALLSHLQAAYPGYQADFVYSPRSRLLHAALAARHAAFDPEQQKMVLRSPPPYVPDSRVQLYTPAFRAQYLALHDDDRYWTGERVLAAQDTFRVLLAIEDGAVAGYLCRDLDRRKQRHDIFRKIRIVHAYHSCYYGTRGTYHGFDYILAVQIHPRVRGDHFRGAGNFENMVESDGVQAFYYIVGA